MLGEELVVVIAGDEVDDGLLRVSRDAARVDVALPRLGRLRRQRARWQREDEHRPRLHRVHELSLRRPRMDREPADPDPHRSGRERLDLQLAEVGAVERVRDVGAERLQIEVLRAPADLLVDGERHPDRRSRPFVAGRREYPTAAMISATPALSSAPSSVVPSLVTTSCPTRAARAGSAAGSRIWWPPPGSAIGPRPCLVHDRRDAGSGDVGRRVDVRDEADDRAVHGARERGEDAVRLVRAPSRPDRSPVARRRAGARARAASPCSAAPPRGRPLRVDPHVAQEPVEDVGGELLGERARERSSRNRAHRAGRRPLASSRHRARRCSPARSRSERGRCTRSRCRIPSRASGARALRGPRRSEACRPSGRGAEVRRPCAGTPRRRA